jgi:hypothetical protein
MTASAQVSNRSVVRSGKVVPIPRDVRPVRPAALTRPRPPPPAPVPPIAPPVQRKQVASPVRGRALPLVAGGKEVERPSALRSGRGASLVVAATVTLVVVGNLGWLGQDANPRIPAETAVTGVGAGETLWDVARRMAPQSDQRAVVERIRQLNGIVGSAVEPGQQLQVPDGQ